MQLLKVHHLSKDKSTFTVRLKKMQRPDILSRGEPARLIPVTTDGKKEAKAASIFLATLVAVPQFRNEILSALGQKSGARSEFHAFTEICFKSEENASLRPDGLITLESGRGNIWKALIEAKIDSAELQADQVEDYLQLAKRNDVQAVITISNQFTALPEHSPLKISRVPKGLQLLHLSWIYLRTTAQLLLAEDNFDSVEQRFILSEFYRYFSHDSVGVERFDQMNAEWKDVVTQVFAKTPLSKNSPMVENTVGAWHQASRDLALLMTEHVLQPVKLKLNRSHSADPAIRIKDDCEHLCKALALNCLLEIPDAAAPISITANLQQRTITVSMMLDAPKDKARATSRINWLLKQLSKANPADIYIRCDWPGRALSTQETLADALERPERLLTEGNASVPLKFEVSLIKDLAGKFGGRRNFLDTLSEVVPDFYKRVGENLRAYVASPPRLQVQEEALDENDIANMRVESGLPIATPNQPAPIAAKTEPAIEKAEKSVSQAS